MDTQTVVLPLISLNSLWLALAFVLLTLSASILARRLQSYLAIVSAIAFGCCALAQVIPMIFIYSPANRSMPLGGALVSLSHLWPYILLVAALTQVVFSWRTLSALSSVVGCQTMSSSRRWLIAFGSFVLGSAIAAGSILFASWPSSTFTSSGSEWYSYVGGKQLVSTIASEDLAASPFWVPGKPLPLPPEEAIALAQESLKNVGNEVADWSFSEIALHNEIRNGIFFYTVSFRPNAEPINIDRASDEIQLLVYFNGKVTLPSRSNRSAP